MKKYTIEEFRNYLNSQDSFGDAFYYLSEKNVDKVNRKKPHIFSEWEEDEDFDKMETDSFDEEDIDY